jgi:hypothetical protein
MLNIAYTVWEQYLVHTGKNKENSTMDLNNVAGMLSVFSMVFSLMALFVGTAGASDMIPPALTDSGNVNHGTGDQLSADARIAMYGQKGADAGHLKAGIRNNDEETVRVWLDAYRRLYKGLMPGNADLWQSPAANLQQS